MWQTWAVTLKRPWLRSLKNLLYSILEKDLLFTHPHFCFMSEHCCGKERLECLGNHTFRAGLLFAATGCFCRLACRYACCTDTSFNPLLFSLFKKHKQICLFDKKNRMMKFSSKMCKKMGKNEVGRVYFEEKFKKTWKRDTWKYIRFLFLSSFVLKN